MLWIAEYAVRTFDRPGLIPESTIYLKKMPNIESAYEITYITSKCHKSTGFKMVSKKKREQLILQLLQEHNHLTLNQIHQRLPKDTKKQIYNAKYGANDQCR